MKTANIPSLRDKIRQGLGILELISKNSAFEVVSQDEQMNIKNMYNGLGYYQSEYPRVFLFGEFKSGKSSLVNAMTRSEYAPTDIFEMTAWVSKFWNSDYEYLKVEYKDGSFEYRGLKEFVKECKDRTIDKEILKKILIVEFGLENFEKKFILIDTPGYGGINAENEKKVIELLYEADLVLFTIDAESIGSMKEAALVSEQIKKGIPYLIVITKADLVKDKAELDSIQNYIEKNYGADPEKIITISVIEGEDKVGLRKLEELLDEYAAGFNSEKRKEAEYGYLKIIAERLISALQELTTKLENVQERVNSFNDYIDSVKTSISRNIQYELEDFSIKSFLLSKREQVVSDVSQVLTSFDGNITEDQMISIFIKNLGKDHFEIFLSDLKKQIPVKMKNQWEGYLDEIEEKSVIALKGLKTNKLNENTIMSVNNKIGNYDIELNQISGKAFTRTMKGSLGFAGVLTAYSAWFGPGAAAISLPAAATVVGLPILAVGAGIAAVMAFVKRNQAKDKMRVYAGEITNSVITKIVQDIIVPTIKESISSLNNEFASAIKKQFYNERMLGLDENINVRKISSIISELKNN